ILEHMLEPGTLDSQDELGNSALMLAVNENAKNTVFLLLEKGAKLDIKNNQGETALLLAKKQGYTHIIQLLSDYQAVNEKRLKGETLLMSAARCGHDDIIID